MIGKASNPRHLRSGSAGSLQPRDPRRRIMDRDRPCFLNPLDDYGVFPILAADEPVCLDCGLPEVQCLCAAEDWGEQ